ncbi:MAG: 4-hydroxy-3-methylbut-2-enyl diphosphate reductase [Prolixibacteraceae bacterium]|nr:4-hydroxy-3-methylbut-2-enyl diphosphate reductase [Prolixibacteraceae bacterium]
MKIEIDPHSGFCFGVQKAISKVEALTADGTTSLSCLGDIVHNHEEVDRLSKLGMKTFTSADIDQIKNETILIRTHGEPPSTYEKLRQNNNQIVDATCPVVLKLQSRVKKSEAAQRVLNGQLVIFGKQGHAEVVGLNGQTGNRAIVVSASDDLAKIDFERPIELYSQTTMPLDAFLQISNEIKQRAKAEVIIHDTVCRQVSNRVPRIRIFAAQHDVVVFVSGKKSSNGKVLFEVCKQVNEQSYFISSPDELEKPWFKDAKNVGICGATSTPTWLMEKVKEQLQSWFY